MNITLAMPLCLCYESVMRCTTRSLILFSGTRCGRSAVR